ncbi:DNA (cytosine-5-)-methyltransferase [Terrabacter sp. RAF57]|uniref:DNA (cytosine-5-)-methyltransferase n=1 Tax=Terrabacter sp. RAF57 TaxID=3233063 RepID=UPI003F944D50
MHQKSSHEMLLELRRQKSHREIAEMLCVNERTVRRWENHESACPGYLGDAIRMHIDTTPRGGTFRFVDLFAGIGGTRLAFEQVGGRCVFTSEWDGHAQQTYAANFGHSDDHEFADDIKAVDEEEVPDHDVLLAGFPCQPFSIAGVSKKNALGRPHGFQDVTQGTLFFDVARIIAAKRPRAFMLENVKNLVSHDGGNTFRVIMHTLEKELGYKVVPKVLDASPFVPQGRRRIIFVGFDGNHSFKFENLKIPTDSPRMSRILHPEDGTEQPETPYTEGPLARVADKYTLTPRLWAYLQDYAAKHRKAGNGFGFGLVGPDDVARTLSARYYKDGSEILVDRGEGKRPRRLTPRECARLMGFPEEYRIPVSDTQAYRQFGNSLVVPLIRAVAEQMVPSILPANERLSEAV